MLKRKSPQQQLFNAIAKADVKKIRKILETNPGIDVNATNGRNMTALDACAERISEEIQKPSKTIRYGNRVTSEDIFLENSMPSKKKMANLANMWNEIADSSGTLKRYANDPLFSSKEGFFTYAKVNNATVNSYHCHAPKTPTS